MFILPGRGEARFLRGLYADNPVIDKAETAIRAFGVDDADTALKLLAMWKHSAALSPRERRAVVSRFISE